MKSTLKKIMAVGLALALCLSFAGCYDENNTWAAKKGELTLPIGAYIYYLQSAYNAAAAEVDPETEVLKATIEEKDAKTWITDRALDMVKSFYYVEDQFQALGLELTEEEQANIDNTTNSLWNYSHTQLEEMGIAKASLQLASSEYSAKYQKVFEAMYGEDGELAVSDEELKKYYTENYSHYESFSAPLTTTDEEGESVDLTSEEKTELRKTLEDYIKKINNGDMTISEAAEDYAQASSTDSTYNAPSPVINENLNSTVRNTLSTTKDNTAVFVETSSNYLVLYKLPIADSFEEAKGNESDMLTLLGRMKGEEFRDYVEDESKKVEGVTFNTSAMNRISVSSFVTENNKKGTSSASSEEASE